jgi:DNA-binding transcriptional regulator/RsmH inhibitor MraZ
LKSSASLSEKSVFAGVADRVEVWDECVWEEYTKSIEKEVENFAEKLGERGAL